jgi:predicted nucleotide-binding protein
VLCQNSFICADQALNSLRRSVVLPDRSVLARPNHAAAVSPAADVSRKVFIVHGRDGTLVARFRDLLRTVGLEPLEWEKLVRGTGSTAPFLGQVVPGRLKAATLNPPRNRALDLAARGRR